MAVVYEKIENAAGSDNGVMTIDHPVIHFAVQLADKTAKLKAGTILKASASGGTYEACGSADTPACILMEDSDGETGLQKAAFHGVAVRARLVDASGSKPKKAEDTLVNKLPGIGIWISQAIDGEVR